MVFGDYLDIGFCHLGASQVVLVVKNLPANADPGWTLVWEDPWSRKLQPASVFLPGESHGQRSLVVYSPWGLKESNTAEQLRVPARTC